MKQWVNDFVLLGVGLWLLGYLASLLLFFSPFQSSMGWIITAVFTPFTIAVAWWWFRTRELPAQLLREGGNCMDRDSRAPRLPVHRQAFPDPVL